MLKFVSFLALTAAFRLLTKTRWIVAPAVGCWLYFRGIRAGQLLVPLAVGAFLYNYFVKTVGNAWAIAAWSLSPSAWSHGMTRPAVIRPTLRANWTAFMFSNPIEIYFAVYLPMFVFWGLHRPPWEDLFYGKLFSAFIVALVALVIRMTITTYQSIAAKRCRFLLLRRFHTEVSFGVRSGVEPVLCAYGSLHTVSDESIGSDDSSPINTEEVPIGELQLTSVEGDWQAVVLTLIKQADVIVIDVTDLSRWIGWEVVQACKAEGTPAIVLIGQVEWLGHNHESVFRMIADAMKEHVQGGDAADMLSTLDRPLAYSKDLSNLLFACSWFLRLRIYHEPRRLSRKHPL